jgi:hypothetical protein
MMSFLIAIGMFIVITIAFLLFTVMFVGLIMFLWKPNENPEPVEHETLEFDAFWVPERNRKENSDV